MELSFVEKIVCDHAQEQNAVFVFPTGISSQMWLERYLEIIGEGSCASEQFIAWDTFKSGNVRSKMQDKKSIPSVMRKLFVSALIAENSQLIRGNSPPLFSALIRPEYEASAASFVKWITSILPCLASWKDTISAINYTSDDDDTDLFTLYKRYSDFLDDHSLFEPAWEKPPFESNEHHYYIFFPEIISDFQEYKKILIESRDITIVSIPRADRAFDAVLAQESRTEIKSAALFIRALAEKKHIPWEKIAVSIPDMESYSPYVLREFSLRTIPFALRSGKKLNEYQTGKFFSQILSCVSQGFSFSALSALLLNSSLPWNNTLVISQLLDFGIKNNCVASWKEDGADIDIWEASLKSLSGQTEELCLTFYRLLKKSLTALCRAASFADVRANYFAFKKTFFKDDFLPESDLILSRCVRELMTLIDIEEAYPDVKPPDHFAFFVDRLSEIDYLPQQKDLGVNIFPYRLAASAPFAVQIVIGAHQDALSSVFQQMKFLHKTKLDILGIQEQDVTEDFINLYKFNSIAHNAAFFCSEHTFSGHAAPHSMFTDGQAAGVELADDYFADEQSMFAFDDEPAAQTFYLPQKKSFDAWKTIASEFNDDRVMNQAVQKAIAEKFTDKQNCEKYKISPTLLKEYYFCGLQWIYNRLFNAAEVVFSPEKMEDTLIGTVYHAVLKTFFDTLAARNDCVLLEPAQPDALPEKYAEILRSSAAKVFSDLPALPGARESLSPLSMTLLKTTQSNIEHKIYLFLLEFLDLFGGYTLMASEKSLVLDSDGYVLNGKIDCVLSDKNQNTVIVDFKKRQLPDRDICIQDELEDFQLPVYTILAESNKFAAVSTALFMRIIDPEKKVIVLGSVKSNRTGRASPAQDSIIQRSCDQGEKILLSVSEYAKKFISEVEAGDCSTIAADLSKCFGCDFRTVCRRTYDVSGGFYDRKWD